MGSLKNTRGTVSVTHSTATDQCSSDTSNMKTLENRNFEADKIAPCINCYLRRYVMPMPMRTLFKAVKC